MKVIERPDRLFDYFVILGPGPRPILFPESKTIQPVVEGRLPEVDRKKNDIPILLCEFVFPGGITCRPVKDAARETSHSRCVEHSFVLTALDGSQYFGVSGIFEGALSSEACVSLAAQLGLPADTELVAERAYCLLSRWPFYTLLLRVVHLLGVARTSVTNVPLERILCNLLSDVPLPPPGFVSVTFEVARTKVSVLRPQPNRLPLCDVPFAQVLGRIGHLLVELVLSALLERKILIVSETPHALVPCAEAVRSLLYPFAWSHVFVPLLPQSMVDVLDAPVPFIIGMVVPDAKVAAETAAPDVTVLDVDRGAVTLNEVLPHQPDRTRKKLDQAVAACAAAARVSSTAAAAEETAHALREAFLRYMVTTMQDYRDYLVMRPEPQPPIFDAAAWVHSFEPEAQAFMQQLSTTQLFSVFIDDRLSPSEEMDAVFERTFFDEQITAKLNRSALRLQKQSTPFLSDDSLSHSVVHNSPLPMSIDAPCPFAPPPGEPLRASLLLPLREPPSLCARYRSQLAACASHILAYSEAMGSREALLLRKAKAAALYEMHEREEEARAAQSKRTERLNRMLAKLQGGFKRRRERKAYLLARRAIVFCQIRFRYLLLVRCIRFVQTRWRYLRARRAILFAQRSMRAVLLRKRYLRLRRAVILCQSCWRRRLARRELDRRIVVRIPELISSLVPRWQLLLTPFRTRLAVLRAAMTPTLHTLVLLRTECARTAAPAAAAAAGTHIPSYGARRALRGERHALADALGRYYSPAAREQLFAAWSVPVDARYRKRRLVKLLLTDAARVMEGAAVLLPLLELLRH